MLACLDGLTFGVIFITALKTQRHPKVLGLEQHNEMKVKQKCVCGMCFFFLVP